MKKLFSFVVLLMAVLCGTNVFAYKEYINDPFVKGAPDINSWNSNRVSDIGAITLSGVNNGNPIAAWFYDADGLIFGESVIDQVADLSIMESKVTYVAEEGEMFFRMDYYYITLTESNMRNFGVRIRLNTGNNWDTIFAIRRDGNNFPAARSGQSGSVDVSVGDKYNGEYVVLQIFFYHDHLVDDAFLMAFNNIFWASYGTEPDIETELASRPFASGDVYRAELNCTNQSLLPITSIEYAYTVNGKAEKKQTVNIVDTLKGKESLLLSLALDIAETDIDTTNEVKIWPVAINGEAYETDSIITFDLTVIDPARLDQNYVPLLECFTSATCPPCRELNPYLNPVLKELGRVDKLNVVKYQMDMPGRGDKYYIDGNGTRAKYYGVETGPIPTLVLNGTERWGSGSVNSIVSGVRERVEAAVAAQGKSFVTIKINKLKTDAKAATVEFDFDVISHYLTRQRVRVHAVVIEGTTHNNWASLSEQDFHYVNMAFATPEEGQTDYLNQEKASNYTYTVNMKNTHMEQYSDLQVVIFVQDYSDKYIHQSLRVKLGTGDAAVEEGQLAQVSLYPNPATGMVYVKGLEKAHVEIFDLTGRKVYETVDANDVLEVSLASFAKGTYVVRISQKDAVVSRKLVVK